MSSVVSRAWWDRAAVCGVGHSLVAVLPPHALRTGHHQLLSCPSPDPLRCRLLCHDLGHLASTVRPLLLSAAWMGHRVCGNTICSLLRRGSCRVPKLFLALRRTRNVTPFVSCTCHTGAASLIKSVAIQVCALVNRDDSNVVLICVSPWVTRFMPRRVFVVLTSDDVIGYRGPRSARKHCDGSLASLSHVSLYAVCLHGIVGVISPSPDAICLTTNLARTAWLFMSCCHLQALPCLRCITAAQDQSAKVGSPDFDSECNSCSSTAHHPDGCAASCHRADHSCTMVHNASHLVRHSEALPLAKRRAATASQC